ncbi:hypothetical protein LCGC14_0377060 [marine sediment metagenome]|uniref:Uncharacterized protein n=1 Tax=marine sediment metagenome TaxID=412755 RepID=A0A0F9T3L6_9ZZZZ
MSVYATIDIKIEIVNTSYQLTVDGWFVDTYKTVPALQEKVAEIITRKTH